MILIIDNYDSFTYNLVQLVGSFRPDVKVVRNDALSVAEIDALAPDGIIISPGPGFPRDAGVSMPLVEQLAGKSPILGVCLGHQAICEAFGATVTYAAEVVHGIARPARMDTSSTLFAGCADEEMVARYHSLAVRNDTLGNDLVVTSRCVGDGEVMAVEHRRFPVFGVQFHPESILTPCGRTIMKNFLARCR